MDFHSGDDDHSPPSSSPPKKRPGRTRHPLYRSVRQRSNGKWVCEVREPYVKSRIWLGTFPTPEMAAVAHDVAILAFHTGDGPAPLNFPESAHLLPRAASCSHQDIQRAAKQAARQFNPPSSSSSSLFPSSGDAAGYNNQYENDDEQQYGGWTPAGTTAAASSQVGFVDEEAVYNMPGLIDSMAAGMLMEPPGFNWSTDPAAGYGGNDNHDEDFTLWKF